MWGSSKRLLAAGALAGTLFSIFPHGVHAQQFRIGDTTGLCEITGATSEEATILRVLKAAVDNNTTDIQAVYTKCKTIQSIKEGKTKFYFPLITLQVGKTDGKVLPSTLINKSNLKMWMEDYLKNFNWTEDQKRQVYSLQSLLNDRKSDAELNIESTAPSIIASSEDTVSVAQTSKGGVGDVQNDTITITTSTVVDGYIVAASITDLSASVRDFWRLQFVSEYLAGTIERSETQNAALESHSGMGTWTTFDTQSMGDSVGTMALNASPMGNDRPWLVVNCYGNKTGVIVHYPVAGGRADGNVDVTMLVEDTLNRATWEVFNQGQSVGIYGGRAIDLAKSLLNSKEFKFKPAAYGFPTDTLTFDLTGIDAAVHAVRQRCDW